jgi:hypothetical protein
VVVVVVLAKRVRTRLAQQAPGAKVATALHRRLPARQSPMQAVVAVLVSVAAIPAQVSVAKVAQAAAAQACLSETAAALFLSLSLDRTALVVVAAAVETGPRATISVLTEAIVVIIRYRL